MAYASGDTITGDQYNIFVNNSSSPFGYNHFAGTGSTTYGLGQAHIATVSGGDTTITASQWNNLLTGITNIANHTNDTITARTQVTAGDSIAIKAAVEADLATLAASVNNGSPNASGGLTTSSALVTSSASSQFNASHIVEQSITFADANRMRHFFNGGGKIRVVTDRTGGGNSDGSNNAKDTGYDTLFAATGNLDIGATATTRSGSGEDTVTSNLSLGQRDLTTSYQTILHLSDQTSPYTDNDHKMEAKLNAAVNSAVTLTVKVSVLDGSADASYTSGNTSGVNSHVDRVGVTRVRLFALSPNTSEGLGTALTHDSAAQVSNAVS